MISGKYDNRVYSQEKFRKVEPAYRSENKKESDPTIIDVEYEVLEPENELILIPSDYVNDLFFVYNRYGRMVKNNIPGKLLVIA